MKIGFQFADVSDNDVTIVKVEEKSIHAFNADTQSVQKYSRSEWIGTTPQVGMEAVTAVDIMTGSKRLVQRHF